MFVSQGLWALLLSASAGAILSLAVCCRSIVGSSAVSWYNYSSLSPLVVSFHHLPLSDRWHDCDRVIVLGSLPCDSFWETLRAAAPKGGA